MNSPDLKVSSPESTIVSWRTGTPPVPSGARGTFWCAIRGANGKIYHRHLVYLNAYIMPLSDSCYDEPENAIPVGDDGEYAWTGWYEESCDQRDTQWSFNQEVIAWMSLPKYSGETSGWKS